MSAACSLSKRSFRSSNCCDRELICWSERFFHSTTLRISFSMSAQRSSMTASTYSSVLMSPEALLLCSCCGGCSW